MKRNDKNLRVCIVAAVVFAVFLVGFFVLSSLIQNGLISEVVFSQSIQAVLALLMFLPLLLSSFFGGRYLNGKGNSIGNILSFVSIALLIFGMVQMLLSLIGVY